VRKRQIYSQKSCRLLRIFIAPSRGGASIFVARESVEASRPARSGPRSFGVAGGERRRKASERRRSSGRRHSASKVTSLRSGTFGREVGLPVGWLFSRIGAGSSRVAGAVTGGRGILRGAAAFGAKILPQGRRDATRGVGWPTSRPRAGDPPQGGHGCPLRRGAPQRGRCRGAEQPAAGSLARAWGFGSRGVRSVRPDT